MSTFGKKALLDWDYCYDSAKRKTNRDRYNSTPKNIQMEILQKWYKIGYEFHVVNVGEYTNKDKIYIVTGYSEHVGFHHVILTSKFLEYTFLDHKNPLNLIPTDEQKRDNILEELGI